MSHEVLGFSESDWDVLQHGPLYMLAHVGGADAYVDSAEWAALIETVRASAGHHDPLVAAATSALAERLRDGHVPVPETPAPLAALEDIAAILAGHGDDAGAAYRVALMEIGAAVADASGATLTIRYALQRGRTSWAPGPATSPMESAALATAAAALGLAVPASQPVEPA